MRQPGRRDCDQSARQVFGWLVGKAGEDDLVEFVGLRLDRFDDLGVAMAMGEEIASSSRPCSVSSQAPSLRSTRGMAPASACWVKGCQTGDVTRNPTE